MATKKSDLSTIKAWWKTLNDDEFLAVTPPTRSCYTQGELHEDATEEIHQLGMDVNTTSYAGWHWQSHEHAFDKKGAFVGELVLHWAGDAEVVRAHLSNPPEGWQLSGGESADEAFLIDVEGADELPAFDDFNRVRKLVDRLKMEAVNHNFKRQTFGVTDDEAQWLHAALVATLAGTQPAIDEQFNSELLFIMSTARLFSDDELDQLAALPDSFEPDKNVLSALLEADHPGVETYAHACDPIKASRPLAKHPSERSLALLKEFAPEHPSILDDLITAQAAVDGTDIPAGLLKTIDEMPADFWNTMRREKAMKAITDAATKELITATDNTPWELGLLTAVVNERIPVEFRGLVARDTRKLIEFLEYFPDLAPAPSSAWEHLIGPAQEALPSLLSATAPDFNANDQYHLKLAPEFETVTETNEHHLHEALTSGALTMPGYAFVLGALCDHQAASDPDVDAVKKTWRKQIAVKDEWELAYQRHPMVALTDICHRLDHPLLDTLMTWWDKDSPKWKNEHRALIDLITDHPENAQQAVERYLELEYGAAKEMFFVQWILQQATRTTRTPMDVAKELIDDPAFTQIAPPERTGAEPVNLALGVLVPHQPMWRTSFGLVLERALRVLENPDSPAWLTELARPVLDYPHIARDYGKPAANPVALTKRRLAFVGD